MRLRLFGVIPIDFSVFALLLALEELKGLVAARNVTVEFTRPKIGIDTGINVTQEQGAGAAHVLKQHDPVQFQLCMKVLDYQRLCDEFVQASAAKAAVTEHLAPKNLTTGPFRPMNEEFQKALTQSTFCKKAAETLDEIKGEIAGYSIKEICRRAILSLFPREAKIEVALDEDTVEAEVDAVPRGPSL